MSTAGTMYDESVRLGFGKLLQVVTLSSTQAVIFAAPFAQSNNFRTFIFDFVNVWPTATYDWLYAQVSADGGASFFQDTYYFGVCYCYSHSGGTVQGNVINGLNQNVFALSGGGDNSNPFVGEVIVNSCPGKNAQLQWHFAVRNPSFHEHNWFGGGVRDGAINAVRFAMASGQPMLKGTIRCYGMRTGG